jgi:hypothetical protein
MNGCDQHQVGRIPVPDTQAPQDAGSVLSILTDVRGAQVSWTVERCPTCTTHTTSSPLSIV